MVLRNKKQLYEPVQVKDLRTAELEIIRLTQQEAFEEEIKILKHLKVNDSNLDRKAAWARNTTMKGTSQLYRLDPFLDDEAIIRVGGRIRNASYSSDIKHPVILPRKHHVTDLIIRHCHETTQHGGRGMTINEIRSNGYWIIECSGAVSTLWVPPES